MRDFLRRLLNVVCAAAQTLIGAFLGEQIGPISDEYPTYVVPADYAFIVWTPIFALTLCYAVYQALPAVRENALLRRIGWFTALAFLANSLWMIVFPNRLFALSVAVIFVILLSLIMVNIGFDNERKPLTTAQKWLVVPAFGIFFGWITVATIANVAQTLKANNWNGFGVSAETWGIDMLLTAAVIAVFVIMNLRRNIAYALTIMWALIGVAVNQFAGLGGVSSNTVGTFAIIAALIVGIRLLINLTGRNAREQFE